MIKYIGVSCNDDINAERRLQSICQGINTLLAEYDICEEQIVNIIDGRRFNHDIILFYRSHDKCIE